MELVSRMEDIGKQTTLWLSTHWKTKNWTVFKETARRI